MYKQHEMDVISFDERDVFADENLESGQIIVGSGLQSVQNKDS